MSNLIKYILLGILISYSVVISILYFLPISITPLKRVDSIDLIQSTKEDLQIGSDSLSLDELQGISVTYSEFSKIKSGMYYDEVTEIIGDYGEIISECDGIRMYAWQNKDGSNCNVMFSNGKVINKAQAMLK